MTKANVIQLGLILFLLGGIGYGSFVLVGFDAQTAGIASQSLLVLLICVWVISYFVRVITGKMTFMEQRKRYRTEYEQVTNRELQKKFDSMTNDQKISLIKELEDEDNDAK
ncbi:MULTISPECIES: DUF3007 family protein [Prochlorococcus]|uniref:Uncharacterized membrane protein n=1 Tax=Prochlorococcus marinus (strain SARG / CCMP1375 / SS120) TaxID=167539 RepID=Q7VD16_PROMA|nr:MULTISPECIES: DUF3007 family protein [Prochlorococcus]AAP99618.1 Uncharacterized membrane protein [Prochlorococcus marinus subsp. marinus str. CCMP1375]KGG11112.1 hypothetical protein EV04_1185 [Prochlorococcus marinus str. LG]KGG21450.1 hypothetical protein EV08_0535 [Prochlorococcus marinus str. SS2]KGG23205.1 hypothetical protein EV09_1953 [Prochlorococcus marinus str. SS35]KGG33916.1 hypothetical protein EV10_0355 [Prochlorococcus marinus str. SS51]